MARWVDIRTELEDTPLFNFIRQRVPELTAPETWYFSAGDYELTRSPGVALPSSVRLVFDQSARIVFSLAPAGVTLTILGEVVAGPHQIFDTFDFDGSTGSPPVRRGFVAGPASNTVLRPEWWGAGVATAGWSPPFDSIVEDLDDLNYRASSVLTHDSMAIEACVLAAGLSPNSNALSVVDLNRSYDLVSFNTPDDNARQKVEVPGQVIEFTGTYEVSQVRARAGITYRGVGGATLRRPSPVPFPRPSDFPDTTAFVVYVANRLTELYRRHIASVGRFYFVPPSDDENGAPATHRQFVHPLGARTRDETVPDMFVTLAQIAAGGDELAMAIQNQLNGLRTAFNTHLTNQTGATPLHNLDGLTAEERARLSVLSPPAGMDLNSQRALALELAEKILAHTPDLRIHQYKDYTNNRAWTPAFADSLLSCTDYYDDEDSDLLVVEGLTLDGGLDRAAAAGVRFRNSELEKAHGLFVSGRGIKSGGAFQRLKAGRLCVRVARCTFTNITGDGLHIGTNTQIAVMQCMARSCFRGGLTTTGAGSEVHVHQWRGEGSYTLVERATGIDVEVDSTGYAPGAGEVFERYHTRARDLFPEWDWRRRPDRLPVEDDAEFQPGMLPDDGRRMEIATDLRALLEDYDKELGGGTRAIRFLASEVTLHGDLDIFIREHTLADKTSIADPSGRRSTIHFRNLTLLSGPLSLAGSRANEVDLLFENCDLAVGDSTENVVRWPNRTTFRNCTFRLRPVWRATTYNAAQRSVTNTIFTSLNILWNSDQLISSDKTQRLVLDGCRFVREPLSDRDELFDNRVPVEDLVEREGVQNPIDSDRYGRVVRQEVEEEWQAIAIVSRDNAPSGHPQYLTLRNVSIGDGFDIGVRTGSGRNGRVPGGTDLSVYGLTSLADVTFHLSGTEARPLHFVAADVDARGSTYMDLDELGPGSTLSHLDMEQSVAQGQVVLLDPPTLIPTRVIGNRVLIGEGPPGAALLALPGDVYRRSPPGPGPLEWVCASVGENRARWEPVRWSNG